MKIIQDVKLDFDEVLLVPKRSGLRSRSEVELEREFKYIPFTGIPIIVANMDHTGTMAMAEALRPYKISVALHKFHSSEDLLKFWITPDSQFAWYTLGTSKDEITRFKELYHKIYPRYICVDVANGYGSGLVDTVEMLRDYVDLFTIIMAGNVVTPDMVYDLIKVGANIVKIGIGPGSACTTRKVTGVGYPQLSAIMECADAAHGVNGHICADGGIQTIGDFSKAFAAGADFVMSGYMFAGHDECEGDFRGMSSKEVQEEYYGEKANYRASEGIVLPSIDKGPVSGTIEEILGGLRSACTYIGARTLKDLPKCATFVRTTRK